MAFFYRFRPTDALLDKFHELEKQVIHFGPAKDLNDPMEGYNELFWQGDAIVWRNLLKHYLLCLLYAFPLALISEKDHFELSGESFVLTSQNELQTTEIKLIYAELCAGFFAHEKVASLPDVLAQRRHKIRRPELHFLLRALHGHAFQVLIDTYRKHRILPPAAQQLPPVSLDDHLEKIIRSLSAAGFTSPEQEEEALRYLFEANRDINEQLDFITYIQMSNEGRLAFHAVARLFPERYIQSLDRLVHREWAAACFVANPNQAAMWGGYGNGHKGVCLKFKASDSGSEPTITLRSITGWSGDRAGIQPVWDDVGFQFQQLSYVEKYPEINFFRSMGVLPIPILRQEWFTNEKGERSDCDEVLSKSKEWYDAYQQSLRAIRITKFRDWEHEKEYRLVLTAERAPLDKLEHRTLTYKFEDLQGIIFGINTPNSAKHEIAKIIQRKCLECGRKDFEYAQAHYSPTSGKIEVSNWGLLKFK